MSYSRGHGLAHLSTAHQRPLSPCSGNWAGGSQLPEWVAQEMTHRGAHKARSCDARGPMALGWRVGVPSVLSWALDRTLGQTSVSRAGGTSVPRRRGNRGRPRPQRMCKGAGGQRRVRLWPGLRLPGQGQLLLASLWVKKNTSPGNREDRCGCGRRPSWALPVAVATGATPA